MGKKLYSGKPFDTKMWTYYRVTWDFVSRLCGCTPEPGVLERHLAGIGPTVRPPQGKSIPDVLEEVLQRTENPEEMREEYAKKSTVGFWCIEDKIVVPTYSIRAHIKDCIRQVETLYSGKIDGEKSFQSRAKNGLYVIGDALDKQGVDVNWIRRDGKDVKQTQIDGYQERTMQVFIRGKGYMSTIKNFAYLVKPTVSFTIAILGKSVKPEDLNTIFQYGAVHGYGGERSMGEGRYAYTIEEA